VEPLTASDAAVSYGRSVLEGVAIRLRALEPGDLALLSSWWQDPGLAVLQSPMVQPRPMAAIGEQFTTWSANTGSGVGFSVVLKDAGKLVGHIALWGYTAKDRNATMGVTIGHPYWGRGYGTDAVRTITRYGFVELGLHRIQLGVFGYNTRAVAAYRAAGYREEGRRRETVWHDGAWHDEFLMGLLDHEWRAGIPGGPGATS
jgi:RimJ/RimL family protein N-acetyltransferase